MTYSGLFLRQYMGQSSSEVPNVTDNWQFSPDLLVYGTTAALNTEVFNSPAKDFASRNWYFSQAPTPGQANYIYVRAMAMAGNITSTVYLFYCDGTTILQPKNWKSNGFSVTVGSGKPTIQNFFSMKAVTRGQQVVNYDPSNPTEGSLITWTPPSGTTPHYYLIAWVDNSSDGSNKPPFATMNDFSSLSDLATYVKNNTNMVYLDTWYQGLFLRQYSGQTNYQAGGKPGMSPDIIITGISAVQDPSTYSSQASYNSPTLQQAAISRLQNFIYIRGLNTSPTKLKARVYLYYAEAGFSQDPPSWRYDTFSVAGKPCNYVDLTAEANAVAFTQMPIVWHVDTSTTYVLIAYVDNDPQDEPEQADFSIFGFDDIETIEQLVATQPRLTWLKIISAAPPKMPDMSDNIPLSIPKGQVYCGLQFFNTTAGQVSISMPGDSKDCTLIKTNITVPEPNAMVTWPLMFDNDLDTSLVFNYWNNTGGHFTAISPMIIFLEKK